MNKYFFSDMGVMLGRSMRHIFRSMDTIIPVTIMPIAFMLLFVYVFGGAIHTGADSYVNYLLPGILLIAIASVSLLVRGIGIMNVMLVSVTELTREIGIRMAIGATEGSVQAQFLGEAVLLSLFGGLMGVLAGVGGSFLLGSVLQWPMSIPPQSIAIAALFASGVGVFFGFYPAVKASHLDPIEALRAEK